MRRLSFSLRVLADVARLTLGAGTKQCYIVEISCSVIRLHNCSSDFKRTNLFQRVLAMLCCATEGLGEGGSF